MNLFLSSTLCWSYPVDEVIEMAEHLGFRGVEVWAEQVWFHHTDITRIVEAKNKTNLDLTFHAASWDLNLCALNEGIRKGSMLEIEHSMLLAKEIGATNVTVHPGKRTLSQSWLPWHFKKLVESFSHLARIAEQLNITISIEQMEHKDKEFIIEPTSMNELLHQLPDNVKVTFDIAHVPLHVDILDYYHQLERINKIHVSDVTQSKYHVPLGSGRIQMETILYMVMEEQYPVVLEGFDQKRDLSELNTNLRFLTNHLNLPFKEVVG